MTHTQFYLFAATVFIAPHLPKNIGLGAGLGILLGTCAYEIFVRCAVLP